MMRARVLLMIGLLASAACKEANLDHCKWRGEHGFCAASFPEAPYCSPCAAVADSYGCVAEPPSDKACPEFEPPATSGGAESSSSAESSSTEPTTSTGVTATSSGESSSTTAPASSGASSESSGSSGGSSTG